MAVCSPVWLNECEHQRECRQDGLVLVEEAEEGNRKEELFLSLVIRLSMECLILIPGHGWVYGQ